MPKSASKPSKPRKCKGKCGFFGTDAYHGWCSKCYAKLKAELGAEVGTADGTG